MQSVGYFGHLRQMFRRFGIQKDPDPVELLAALVQTSVSTCRMNYIHFVWELVYLSRVGLLRRNRRKRRSSSDLYTSSFKRCSLLNSFCQGGNDAAKRLAVQQHD